MRPFDYRCATSPTEALSIAGAQPGRYLGGGTNLVDLMRQNIEAPAALIDVSRLPGIIEDTPNGGLSIGASVRNSVAAAHPSVRSRFPMLSRALLAGASAQIRNMATIGGNILQRTRCPYFYDATGSRCNKREPGSGCDAIGGFNRYHAIFGASEHCIATHPSDMCVALAALNATVQVAGPGGERDVPLLDLHRLPGDRPDIETILQPGELITAIALSPSAAAANSTYRKVRDRSSYAFALISVAAGLEVAAGRIVDVTIALGGVAAKPWRALRAEQDLRGAAPTKERFLAAADAELAAARTLDGNAFKVEFARRTVAAVLCELAGVEP
ncbi:FAD binding domain-containing protein [Bradyrhizobium sp. ORS 111]|uniref:FAD binding domain-containing protein n=1 Tax=Bradyrhizobium sp. ORS 111 TaxID=1685958 RepID=UPI0038901B8A